MIFYDLRAAAVGAAVSVITMTGAVQAATTVDYDGAYEATSVTTGGNDHTFWLPGLFDGVNDAYWQFVGGAGDFRVSGDNGVAELSGTIENNTYSQYQFEVDISYALRLDAGVAEMRTSDQVKRGGIEAPLTNDIVMDWAFYDITSATLTGIDLLDGLVLTLSAYPNEDRYPFQLGDGANDKNAGLGASGWIDWTVTSQPTDYEGSIRYTTAHSSRHGDINLNLTAVPLPASALLLLAGIGGLGAMRRRKSKS